MNIRCFFGFHKYKRMPIRLKDKPLPIMGHRCTRCEAFPPEQAHLKKEAKPWKGK